MLLGCCHCGETPPSESIPPSESTPPSVSESVPPSESDSGPSYSEISSSCISSFGCAAIPRRLTWNVSVSGGTWDGSADCLCSAYDGTYTLKFCDCQFATLTGYRLFYATDELGTWRGRPGFPNTDLVGCRTKTAGTCVPLEGSVTTTRKYYAVVTPNNIRVFTTTYYTSTDTFPFSRVNATRQWEYTGSVNCLASSSYSLTKLALISNLDGCGWATTGTLTPG